MRTRLLILALVVGCIGCHDERAKQKQFDKKIAALYETYLTGDILTAEQARSYSVRNETLSLGQTKSGLSGQVSRMDARFRRALAGLAGC